MNYLKIINVLIELLSLLKIGIENREVVNFLENKYGIDLSKYK